MNWSILDALPPTERERLLEVSRRRTFSSGEVVFHRGDPADTLHLIASGRFAVQIRTPEGVSATLALLGPGETFGELALLGGVNQGRSATIVAVGDGETRSIHTLDFDRVKATHPAVSDVLLLLLRAQVQRLSKQLVEAMYTPADRRVLRRLLDASGLYESEGDDRDGVVVPLTQDELAELAGTSRATVNKIMREMEKRGALELLRGRTIIRDRAVLMERAGIPLGQN